MNLSKFFRTDTGKHVMSAILGFGLATIFRAACKDRNCIIFKAPPLDEIENKVYEYDSKCYKFKTKIVKCDKSKKTVTS
tara:strand:- start:12263 stop:12499 length:237 start_codon:yes stop_codon:yes gene_type:complete